MTKASLAQGKQLLELFAGATTDEVQRLIAAGDLLKLMMQVDLSRIDREAFAALLISPPPALFCTPQEVLGRFLIYQGENDWPFGLDILSQLRETMPTNHVSDLNKVLALDVWLGDLPTTFEALAGWIEYEQRQAGNGFWRWGELRSDAKYLCLLDPKRYGKLPSVKWVELDMLANWDKRNGTQPRDVRDPKTSAGRQVMTAFAIHPAYPPAIDYETIPGAWMAGLQANIPGSEAWALVPILRWYGHDRKVYLRADWDDYRYRGTTPFRCAGSCKTRDLFPRGLGLLDFDP